MLLPAVLLLVPASTLHADGGTVRLSERQGDYRITVFTSPVPLRAGPVDVSIFVQDATSGEPVPDVRIAVRATPRDHPGDSIRRDASSEAATNKLFQAAVFELPASGWWDVEIVVAGLRQPVKVGFAMEADEPLPPAWQLAPWLAWPAAAILLFGVHQWLVWRKTR